MEVVNVDVDNKTASVFHTTMEFQISHNTSNNNIIDIHTLINTEILSIESHTYNQFVCHDA